MYLTHQTSEKLDQKFDQKFNRVFHQPFYISNTLYLYNKPNYYIILFS